MFRKILIASVASLALIVPLAMPAQSDARPAHVNHSAHHNGHRHGYRHGHRGAYRVYYRNGGAAWCFDGSYGCRTDALRESTIMQTRGFQTVIR